jgi:hypothetical protein
MDSLLKVFLGIHIVSGYIALLSGLIAILTKKGQKNHKKAGIIYFYSMLGVSASALVISIIKSNEFLLYISIFAFFETFNGYRSVKVKDLKAKPIDWIVLLLGLVNTVLMILSKNMILMVFGGISIFLIYSTFVIYFNNLKNKPQLKMIWLPRHIGMMLGAYIATTTAFIVVNLSYAAIPWLPWLLPTFIGVPLIFYFTNKYRPKKI